MSGPLTWQMAVQVVMTLIALFMLVRGMLFNQVPKSRYFVLLACAVLWYSIGYLLELDAHSLEAAYMAQRVQYYGVSVYAVLFYLFVRDYGDRPLRNRWVMAGLFVFPLVVVILVNAYPDITWYFAKLEFVQETRQLLIARGPVHHLHVLYSILFVGLSAYEVLRYYPRQTPQNRVKRVVFVLAALVPGVAATVFAVDVPGVPMQFGSASLVVSLMLFGAYIAFFREEDWLPFARDRMMEEMCDGFVLLDAQDGFLDANPAAIRFFPGLEGLPRYTPITQVRDFPENMLMETEAGAGEVTLARPEGEVTLQLSHTPIYRGEKLLCNSILMFDVTEKHQLMDELEEIASHDGLTGLLNRQAFSELAGRDVEIHRRTGDEACVLMMDLDFFKAVNDTYGHPCGDYVLQVLAALMNARMRRTDILGRYGGEEFIAFLPTTGLAGAMVIASQVRQSVENHPFLYEGQPFRLTISIGVAQMDPQRHSCLEEMITDADAALYEAKGTGRNRVVAYTAPKTEAPARRMDA